jgi:hypothetical protein
LLGFELIKSGFETNDLFVQRKQPRRRPGISRGIGAKRRLDTGAVGFRTRPAGTVPLNSIPESDQTRPYGFVASALSEWAAARRRWIGV